MCLRKTLLAALLAGGAWVAATRADDRRFTYTYEPETPPARDLEYENWVTLGLGRSSQVGQDHYSVWALRQEVEYGVTDRYALGLYVNESVESYHVPPTGSSVSSSKFQGVSLENRYNFLNPADHAIGFTGYLEGTYSGENAELEAKLIFGQRHGDWKWALNLDEATEWEDHLSQVEGELGASFGIARDLGRYWSVGLELRNRTLLPDYQRVESTALFLGPVVSYHRARWWAALTVLPQIYGWNFGGDPDGSAQYELVDHEKIEIRLLFGVSF
jgi:hypothetical protein